MAHGVGGLPQPNPHRGQGAGPNEAQGKTGDNPPPLTSEQAVYQLEIAIFNSPGNNPTMPQSIPEWIALSKAINDAVNTLKGATDPNLQAIVRQIEPLQAAAKNVLADGDTSGSDPNPNFNKINTDVMPIRAAYNQGVFKTVANSIANYWNAGHHQAMSPDVVDALKKGFTALENDIQTLEPYMGQIQNFAELPQPVIQALQSFATDTVSLCNSLSKYAASGELDGFTLQFYDLMSTRYSFPGDPNSGGFPDSYDSLYSFCNGLVGSTGAKKTSMTEQLAEDLLKPDQESVINLTQVSNYLQLVKINDSGLFSSSNQ